MELKKIEAAELRARQAELENMLADEDADLDAIETEAREIKEELERRAAEEEKKKELRNMLATGKLPGVTKIEEPQEKRKMTDEKEIRNSKAYIDAYANYIKTGEDTECRAILTTNTSDGILPVPDLIVETVKTAWERDDIMNRVRATALRGNVKVGFELSATGAVVHIEGDEAPQEEEIMLGIVTMIPQTIMKWLSVSDEALDMGGMGGAEFLTYIYDEITYRIAKECAKILLNLIASLPQAPTATSVSAAKITAAPALATVAAALANLNDQATRPVVIMNRLTWAAFKEIQYAGNYAVDPFEGLEVVFNNNLPAYDDATSGQIYMIVGDLFTGAQANYPNGSEIRVKVNDLSRAKEGLVEFVGRRYVGLGVVTDKAFALVAKPAKG